jgi:hypothetical protein
MEGGTRSRFRLHPHAATVPLHDLLADCQANARAGIFLTAMQALENNEDPVKILLVDANAVIAHAEAQSERGVATRFASSKPADGNELEQLPAEPEDPRAIA